MEQRSHPSWIRMAGHAENIRANLETHWRCAVGRQLPLIPLVSWSIVGNADGNIIPGTAPTKDALGLTAWIDFYGILSIDKDRHATIQLCDPHAPSR